MGVGPPAPRKVGAAGPVYYLSFLPVASTATILVEFVRPPLMDSFCLRSSLVRGLAFGSFFSSLTLSAYLIVFRVSSQLEAAGEIFAIMVVFEFPMKESFKT